ncbi:cupin domain-containing protein [Marinicella sp. S1101]|uniref:cupin domain-containing protein n=1 Tax=Marinicella marina TaxID=2996016 RepID=UPI002260E0A5|nr:cupin domain-containing protein [Marinicella marina]MCX7552540.1 cupin domain-containing protein [Marinicella marina]MDJ1139416.1 cupin domain-containing protein [Marinicella marina]
MNQTNLNMDFTQRLVMETEQMQWSASPSPTVFRKRLARAEAEQGHATSIVKYEPGATFKTHHHPKGEEILVLDGVFSDEHGDYPAGTYLRNPDGTSHAPFSKKGCVLLVKLCQFQDTDTAQIKIDTNNTPWRPGIGGLEVMPLHNHIHENTALVKWPKGEIFQPHTHFGGEEIFVLSGTFKDENGNYPKGTWIRSPHLSSHHPYVDEETIIWVKTGHLT